jgi:WD40 repeat protein
VIGHRSGFIEGAAFIGIPVFYLNNERVKTHLTPGDILWKPVDPDLQSRLGELADVTNTFIPIDVLKEVDREIEEKGKHKSVAVKVPDDTYRNDLMAALFVYMCCNLIPSRYRFDALHGNYLGWTARVEMMHDRCVDRHPERDECLDIKTFEAALNYMENHMVGETAEAQKVLNDSRQYSNSEKSKQDLVDLFTSHCGQSRQQTGQEWLKRRFCFALDNQLKPGLLLQCWSRARVDQERDKELIVADKKLLDSKAIQVPEGDYDTHDVKQIRRACEVIANLGTPSHRAAVPYHFKSNFNPNKSTIYCLQVMESFLRPDLSKRAPTLSLSESTRGQDISRIPWEVRYACQHWVEHYRTEKITDPWIVEQFLRKHLLHWIQAMGVLRMLPAVVEMLDALKTILQKNPFFLDKPMPDVEKYVSLADLLDDAKEYIQFNLPCIQKWRLQVYESAPVFAPLNSLIRRLFLSKESPWISTIGTSSMAEIWKSIAKTPTERDHSVILVTFSPDGSLVASTRDRTLYLWKTAKGVRDRPLDGHTAQITSIVFSSDGILLASASKDTTLWPWDTHTRVRKVQLIGHTDVVIAVTFCANGFMIASGSDDRTVRLWVTATGVCTRMLVGHSDGITSIAFSPDGSMLASTSRDKTVRLCKTSHMDASQELIGHLNIVTAVAFSPDGSKLVSASEDATLRLWRTAGMDHNAQQSFIGELVGHEDGVTAVAFSLNGSMLASTSNDETIRVWNADTCREEEISDCPTGVDHISFSDGTTICTNAGVDNVPFLHAKGPRSRRYPWIEYIWRQDDCIRSGKHALWRPPKYRGPCSAACGDDLVIGQFSGAVSFFRVSQEAVQESNKDFNKAVKQIQAAQQAVWDVDKPYTPSPKELKHNPKYAKVVEFYMNTHLKRAPKNTD